MEIDDTAQVWIHEQFQTVVTVGVNLRAIDALAAVTRDERRQAMWYEVANNLSTAAESGNAVAVDALVAMTVSTNQIVRNAVVLGLKRAAANQNTKATETLRSMGVQWLVALSLARPVRFERRRLLFNE